ncbi:MAG: DUF58 domain-containing protein [Planctomycetes bacterium]|nr:DUF58 domain-containing protein [Planctomycetota bacterium]
MQKVINLTTAQPLNSATPQRLNSSAPHPPSPWPGRRLRLTREGWAALGLTIWILGAALMSHASLILLVFCMLVGILVVSTLQTIRNARNLAATLRLPDHAAAGQPFRLEFVVHNRRRFGTARAIALTSELQPATGDIKPSVFLPAVAPRSQVTERKELTLQDRGLYRFSDPELITRYPFGFLEQSVRLGGPQELLVYPRLGKLSRRFLHVQREDHLRRQGHRPGVSPEEADYHGLREFRPGDSPRWIHWATTARRARLMVREFEARHNRDVAVLLEPWLPARGDDDDRRLLELAISFAATLLVELCKRESSHVLLGIASDPPVIRHGQSCERLLHELLAHLALLRGTAGPQWDALIHELPPSWTSEMRITAVSPRRIDLVSRLQTTNGLPHRKWQRLTRRLVEVDVSNPELHEFFELQQPCP